MKIKLLRNVGIGGVFHKPGDVVEVTRNLGLEMIGGNRAELVDGEAAPTGGVISTEPFPEGEEENEPEPVEQPEPESPKRGKGK